MQAVARRGTGADHAELDEVTLIAAQIGRISASYSMPSPSKIVNLSPGRIRQHVAHLMRQRLGQADVGAMELLWWQIEAMRSYS